MVSIDDRDAPQREPFDPDAAATGDGIYGLPFTPEESAVILIPVPWEATVSYRAGTAGGPGAILEASRQVDLYDREFGRPYEGGIAMLPIPGEVVDWNIRARKAAGPVIEYGGIDPAREDVDSDLRANLAEVNRIGELVNSWVYTQAWRWLDRGRLVGVVGGDHSSPFGLIRALAERRPGLGILHVDAHADMRKAYEGFVWSHASIFRNVLGKIPGISRVVQVGIRDYSEGEHSSITSRAGEVRAFFDADLRARMAEGETWGNIVREIAGELPREVYISFDIDGLDPSLCPNTGTPVPGGLGFSEACLLLKAVADSGRTIAGFDLCEVAPDPEGRSEWDGNVGARILYKMIGLARASSASG